ncbi:thiamine transport system substrate-binding protein [Loktanella ponticola]|uniref:Thiamine transport system substrate-binding protein n=1 Tax=Yoonia ponticola TaxID=1524255 RepID=A0A7W9BHG5_9RHOB|nr:thiamine ABC transporter substrate binding subunit [Yoonia ponticola]MBB5720555.1 thiamine transport system substrate-binding protein [Yoonia ponticola]
MLKTTYLTAVAGLCVATVATAEVPKLTVLTYDSFTTEWGPGPAIEAAFEETCACDLEFVGAGDGAALLARLQLEGLRTEADIVLGLDTNLTAAARETGLFAPHGIEAELTLPLGWTDTEFLPYDWSYFAFVGNEGAEAPTSLQALADSDIKIVIQDPRSSTPGLGLLLWVKDVYGDDAPQFWADLADNIITVTPGWSEAYGLFIDGEADAVLSYTTSPAYHLIAEDDASKVAWAFDDGHYMQVEVAGKVAGTNVPEIADQFLAFMVSDGFQSIIPTTNWMYPAATPADGLPEGFDTLVVPELSLLKTPEDALAIRDEALAEWREALSQ